MIVICKTFPRITKNTTNGSNRIITGAIVENKLQFGIIKTNTTIIFPYLQTYRNSVNPQEKIKIMKRGFTEGNIHTFKFLFRKYRLK